MKFKEFINNVLFLISVPKCAACGERLSIRENVLCESCKQRYDELLEFNCSVCAKPYYACECTNKYLDAHYVHKVYKVFRYFPADDPPTNMLIYRLKRDNRYDVVKFLAGELHKSLLNKNFKSENTILTNVPRRRKSIVKYSFDHSEKLAKELSKLTGIEYKKLFVSRAKNDQKKSRDKDERKRNAQFDYKKWAPDIQGKNVIIIDDIITTGASVASCATLLHGLGAKRITALALSIAYKDDIS